MYVTDVPVMDRITNPTQEREGEHLALQAHILFTRSPDNL